MQARNATVILEFPEYLPALAKPQFDRRYADPGGLREEAEGGAAVLRPFAMGARRLYVRRRSPNAPRTRER
jgi:hypothetical protein